MYTNILAEESGGHNSPFHRIETKRVRISFAAYKSIVIRHSNVLHSYKRHYELGNVRFVWHISLSVFVYIFLVESTNGRTMGNNAKCSMCSHENEN